uniref:alpha/beta fold hydrolase n=1 Tax=Nonomuraea bangladeshensis TaxID=404385 RepID=UPI003F4911A4
MTDKRPNTAPFMDYGGPGIPVLALHGHFGSCRTFAGLARQVGDAIRLIAPDQRGHGHAGSRSPYTLDDYVADAAAFVETLELGPMVVLGHSMGGVVAYTLASRHPELVRAVVVEDAPAVVGPQALDVRAWPRRASTLKQLCEQIESQGLPDASYFVESAVRYADGWGVAFDYEDLMESQHNLAGDYWAEWLSVSVPMLLLHGHGSLVVPTAHAREMIERRPATRYEEFPHAGHWLHDDDLVGVGRVLTSFVTSLDESVTTSVRSSS